MYTVYKHTCPSGKVYIGITAQVVENRWLNGKGYIKCPLFFNAIKKYGWENIKHEILKVGLCKEDAEREEIRLIAKYQSNDRKYGYNIANGGNHKGKCSEDTRIKIGLSQIGRKQSAETIEKRIVKGPRHYLYGKHMPEETKTKISKAKMGSIVDDATRRKISETLKGKAKSTEHVQRVAKSHWVKVQQLSLCGELVHQYDALIHAAVAVNGTHSKISMCCNGKRKTAYGYKWQYAV